jgi:hypothetical protein
MEHDSDPTPEEQVDEHQSKPINWLRLIAKLIIGAIVLFIAAFALVFGACLLG